MKKGMEASYGSIIINGEKIKVRHLMCFCEFEYYKETIEDILKSNICDKKSLNKDHIICKYIWDKEANIKLRKAFNNKIDPEDYVKGMIINIPK